MENRPVWKLAFAWLYLVTWLLIPNPLPAAVEVQNKLAFLRDGEVWLVDTNGQNQVQLTQTQGKVDHYRFSPTLEYLAYSQVIKEVPKPGVWRKSTVVPESPKGVQTELQRPVVSIQVLNLQTLKIDRDLQPPKDNWFYFKAWLPEDQLLFIGASGFDVWGHFVYDAREKKEKKVFDYQGYRFIYGFRMDLDIEPSTVLYVSESGTGDTFREELNCLDTLTHARRTVFSKPSLLWPKLSHGGKSAAVLETEYRDGQLRDKLWLVDVEKGGAGLIYSGEMQAKGDNGLSWSPDDAWLAVDMKPRSAVVSTQSPGTVFDIAGSGLNWVNSTALIYSDGTDVFGFDLEAQTVSRILINASQPMLLKKAK
jgi:Tol biopolymer transport system component